MTALALDQHRLRQFLSLTKPRVVSLIVFTAVIGMFLAVPGLPPLKPMLFGTLGIALVAAAAAVIIVSSSKRSTPRWHALARDRCRAESSRRNRR
jgi:heme O synthase-like polyprenyltransferase